MCAGEVTLMISSSWILVHLRCHRGRWNQLTEDIEIERGPRGGNFEISTSSDESDTDETLKKARYDAAKTDVIGWMHLLFPLELFDIAKKVSL